MPKPLSLKVNDRQPYYYARAKDSNGNLIDITDATIYCTMKNVSTGTVKINRQDTGIVITDGPNSEFEYRWQDGDTDTSGLYDIEFEVNPVSGGKFTVPTEEEARVRIYKALDGQ